LSIGAVKYIRRSVGLPIRSNHMQSWYWLWRKVCHCLHPCAAAAADDDDANTGFSNWHSLQQRLVLQPTVLLCRGVASLQSFNDSTRSWRHLSVRSQPHKGKNQSNQLSTSAC